VTELGTDGWGHSELGDSSGVLHTWRERRDRRPCWIIIVFLFKNCTRLGESAASAAGKEDKAKEEAGAGWRPAGAAAVAVGEQPRNDHRGGGYLNFVRHCSFKENDVVEMRSGPSNSALSVSLARLRTRRALCMFSSLRILSIWIAIYFGIITYFFLFPPSKLLKTGIPNPFQ
jgi:hypothetical protein